MLSPNDIAPKHKTPSIWSVDSGYGSNTLEDDEVPNKSTPSPLTEPPLSRSTQLPIGLGLGNFWNVRVGDKLRLRRPDAAIEPVTTRLNVFTTKDGSSTDYLLPAAGNIQETCATCRFRNITWPGKNLKCDDCCSETFIVLKSPHVIDEQKQAKNHVPRLEIPNASRFKQLFIKSQASPRCSACEIALLIDSTKPAKCDSCNPGPDHLSPISAGQTSTIRRSCAKRPTRLPPRALQGLQAWLRDHRNNPYPDANTKRLLADSCGISAKQVNTWFTNARARGLLKDVDRSNLVSEDDEGFEDGRSGTGLMYKSTSDHRRSPTSDHNTSVHEHSFLTKSRRGKKKDYSQLESISPTTGQTPSIPPTPPVAPSTGEGNEQEKWQCTFCYQHIAPKSWRRHEETQHRPKRKWTCLPDGPRVIVPSHSGAQTICAFCLVKEPSDEHLLQSHRTQECILKSEKDRTFLRPDHLRQHVQNFHKATLHDTIRDLWRKDAPTKHELENWPCGFCGLQLNTWDTRETHIAGHFKDGLTMAHWNARQDLDSPAAPSKKRRNESPERSPSIFSKLARTFPEPSGHQQYYQHQPSPVFPPTLAAASASTPSLLLHDMALDTFMAEACGNTLVAHDPAHDTGTCYPFPEPRCDSAFPHEGEGDGPSNLDLGMDLDLDLDLHLNLNLDPDTDLDVYAFLHNDAPDFHAPWEHRD